MHDDGAQVQARISRFILERLQPAVYPAAVPARLGAWHVPGEPVPFAEAVAAGFSEFTTGSAWGPPWSTSWFRLTGQIPAAWTVDAGHRPELLLDPGFTPGIPGFQAEGLVYTPQGSIIKAIEPRNPYVPLDAQPGAAVELYLEAAANPDLIGNFTFQPTLLGDPATSGQTPCYTFRQADIALRDVVAWELLQDFTVLEQLILQLDPGQPRRAQILRALEHALSVLDPADIAGTAAAGRAVLEPVLSAPAAHSAHRIHAVGHAHIDSAWLWPVRETKRKIARTFANVVALQESDPEFVFAASSAQQYAWLKESQPELFARVADQIRAGRFVPVGGMWVESDTNMPGGEALARQFIAGKKFFLAEFGVEPQEVWLPDSFGYSAAMPQIARAAGSRWFLTQKLSWNETNTFPHHTFWWEGIDGSRIFTHFPPADTYNAELTAADLARAERHFAEKGAANTSLLAFGYGDGGGGPTREMLAAAHRTADLEGSPRVQLSSPERFFRAAEEEYDRPPVWSGELYLEYHRGTYTSQSRTKRGNRRSEHLLREAELWAATAAVRGAAAYPYDALERAWQTVLLQQFHDILPGSSIAWVHREAEANYARLAAELAGLIDGSLRALLGRGASSAVANAGPYPMEGVPALGAISTSGPAEPAAPSVVIEPNGDGWLLDNGLLRVVIDSEGLISSLMDVDTGREVIPGGMSANLLQLFRDTPTRWDAWELEEHYKSVCQELREVHAVEVFSSTADSDDARPEASHPGDAPIGPVPLRGPCAGLQVSRRFGSSQVTQTVWLAAGSRSLEFETTVDWHERQKLLKLAFPLDLQADRAASEIQFGHVFRPTHSNTSWDAARFETCAHRWVQVGEPGFGIAVANDCSYGHDIRRTDSTATPATVVRQSLLRAPLYPDPQADQGEHTFRTSLVVGAGIPEAVRAGYRLNLPPRRVQGVGAGPVEPLFTVDNPAVVIEAVKLAEDRSGDVILRCYEAFGSRAEATIGAGFGWVRVSATDLLERDVAGVRLEQPAERTVRFELRPFQLLTLRFHRGASG
ncbi:alpha-mannosidase [Arthrobacter sp. CAU 1506]|uniref:alpha-mannosidase n=1 Tax=Arthrobacter sp. CAU 1506 TaxID=2560052 RepID=UPI0010ACF7E4|nr:glycoside hydrolase family 38 C-terminal domain-containing protein [Arthrobacter sp. CAU 1506]TJY72260.1 alpha-mannosidase [Arthrobacter sp. CAU 1506]